MKTLLTASAMHLAVGAAIACAQSPDSIVSRATRLFETGDSPAAVALLAPIGETAQAALLLGRIAWQGGDYKEAGQRFDKAIALAPQRADPHVWRARTYLQELQSVNFLRKGSIAGKARGHLEKAITLEPENFDAQEALTEYYMEAPGIAGGGIDKARAQAATAKRLSPVRGALLVARVETKDKNAAATEAEYRWVTSTFPDSVSGWAALSSWYQDQKRWTEAFEIIDTRLRGNPSDNNFLYQLGRAASLSGTRLDAGEAALRKYLARENARPVFDSSVHYRLGSILEQRGNRAGARDEYLLASKVDPRNEVARRAANRLAGQ